MRHHVPRTGAGAARRSAHGSLVAGRGALRDGDAAQAVQRCNGATNCCSEIIQKPAPPATGASPELQRIVARCLAKDPTERYQTAAELVGDLGQVRHGDGEGRARISRAGAPRRDVHVSPCPRCSRSPLPLVLPAGRCRQRRCGAGPATRPYHAPARLPIKAATSRHIDWPPRPSSTVPADPALRDLWPDVSRDLSVDTTPEGADASWKPYADVNGAWQPLGTTPVRSHRLPLGPIRIRLVKTGYQPLEVAASAAGSALPRCFPRPARRGYGACARRHPQRAVRWHRQSQCAGPRVPHRSARSDQPRFQGFVDAGGYTTRAYWTEPFVDGDRTLSWENAMGRFIDPTGRPGPATWDGGAYKDGEADDPVAGVSWYEAAAYAAFAGRSLPTVYHWFRAANTDDSRFLVALSNFSGKGPRGRRAFQCDWFLRSSRYGRQRSRVVLECERPSALSARRLLGGSGLHVDQRRTGAPLDRSITNGFRCAKYSSSPLSTSLTDPIIRFRRLRISVLRPRATTRSKSTKACMPTSRPK